MDQTTKEPQFYTLREDWNDFAEEVERCDFSGPSASSKLLALSKRVKSKRLKTVTRLLKGVRSFGCLVEFDSEEDELETPFTDSDGCNGVFTEKDQWIHLNMDLIRSWKGLEEVLAHEAVHLCQNVVYRGERTEDCAMEISMDRIWSCYDSNKYREWLEGVAEEDFPIYEVEAYSEMVRPRGVACSLEYLRSKSELWANVYHCSING
jgi:hypothetical protein